MKKQIKDILRCPNCGAKLNVLKNKVDCHSCFLSFPVKDGIPVLLTEQASKIEKPLKD